MGMPPVLAAAEPGFRLGLTLTALGFGFRHGIDWDHLAAIADITGTQETTRRSMLLATLYALGHAAVVFTLGVAAIVAGDRLPAGVDAVMEHVVGATLLFLGIYVFVALARQGRNFRMRSRWMLLFAGARRGVRWLRARTRPPEVSVVIEHEHEHRVEEEHEQAPALVGAGKAASGARTHRHPHRHVSPLPDDPFLDYSRATAFGVGMLHGIGAETPTQVLLFVAAAGVGGRGAGVMLLVCFLVGLLTSNTVVALASSLGFVSAGQNFRVYATVSVVTGVFSLVIGSLFLLGRGTVLPALFGG